MGDKELGGLELFVKGQWRINTRNLRCRRVLDVFQRRCQKDHLKEWWNSLLT